MTDQELKDLVASLATNSQKTDEQMRELKTFQQKTDEQMRELKTSQQKTDEQMRKTDEQMQKTDEQMRKTDKKLDKLLESHKRLGKMVGGISNSQGDVAEEFFYNSLANTLQLGGIQYDEIIQNMHKRRGDVEDEYDILLVNGKDVAIIETKYKAHQKDLQRLLETKYANFKKLYPEYKDFNKHLALASFHMNDEVKQEALNSRVIVLQRKGKLIETIMPTS